MARAYSQYANRPGQQMPEPGRESDMVLNNAGGYSFKLDDWERLNRFLILGSENGSYYVRENVLTAQNVELLTRCIKADGVRVVAEATAINVAARAPKPDSQLYALVIALQEGDADTKRAAEIAARRVLRTGSHLLQFASLFGKRKFNSAVKRRIFTTWFNAHDSDWTAFQMLKYRERYTYHMRDLLRLSHPKPPTAPYDAAYAYLVGKRDKAISMDELPAILQAFDNMAFKIAHNAELADAIIQAVLRGINDGLPREALPTESLTDLAVLRRLLPQMPPHALLRNLARLSSRTVLDEREMQDMVIRRLTDLTALQRARVHPFNVLLALVVYLLGSSPLGGRARDRSQTWIVQPRIVDALMRAFEKSQANTKPTYKRILFAIDISGSMWTETCVGTPIMPADAAGALVMALARHEPHARVIQFSTGGYGYYPGMTTPQTVLYGRQNNVVREVIVDQRTALQDLAVPDNMRGGTDLAMPIQWALATNAMFDAFVILTDNETWAGRHHASALLAVYREKLNPQARLVCASMSANHANIVDPLDTLSMGCAGLDGHLAGLIAGFVGNASPALVGDGIDESDEA